MKALSLIIVAISMMLTAGCGYNAGVRTAEATSYIYFTGDVEGVEVFIDETPAFVVTAIGPKNVYKLSPGVHTIVLKRNSKVLSKRRVMYADGTENEYNVPKR